MYFPLHYGDKIVGKNFCDFIIEDCVVVEIKKGDHFAKSHIDQVLQYLKITKNKLALLINFGNEKVSFKRLINFN